MLPVQPKKRSLDIVAIGASAGGVEAIAELLSRLPDDLAAAVLVVMHRDPDRTSSLHDILARTTGLKVAIPKQGDRLKHGVCLVGTPLQHLTIGPGLHVQLLLDHFYRAHNIDALFNSLARNVGNRTIGVILSGYLKDGSQGLKAIKEAGGMALVQSPDEASAPQMPQNAIRHGGPVDLIAPVNKLAEEIVRVVGRAKLATPEAAQ